MKIISMLYVCNWFLPKAVSRAKPPIETLPLGVQIATHVKFQPPLIQNRLRAQLLGCDDLEHRCDDPGGKMIDFLVCKDDQYIDRLMGKTGPVTYRDLY